ncbi:DUF4386 domain-containing protein [Flexithrix dorotheae]|uniref:DUF4386 domain-containing protein n=1 Tax=Flexithrix dorotheae TaxID=70993 RepID=UPI000379B292|nr:DUF4386 domain-containing protein [Flexithrix dorotheae]
MNTYKNRGRMAGLLFLILIFCGVFAEFFVRQKIMVYGDPVATAQNIKSMEDLFRVGIVSDLIMSTTYFFFPLLLYPIFKLVNKELSMLMVLCVMISVAILCINMLNQIAALLLVTGSDYFNGFSTEQLQSLSSFFLNLHSQGYKVAQIFYGLYLFPLGYMIYKSGYLPRVIGVFLMLGFVGDMIDFLRFFLIPDYPSVILDNITLPADIGEISMCLWLLIKGVKVAETEPERELVV